MASRLRDVRGQSLNLFPLQKQLEDGKEPRGVGFRVTVMNPDYRLSPASCPDGGNCLGLSFLSCEMGSCCQHTDHYKEGLSKEGEGS